MPPNQLGLVREWLASQHIRVLPEWIEACLDWINEEYRNAHLSNDQLKQLVYEQWQDSDLTEIATPCLPEGLSQVRKTMLNGAYVLQISCLQDVGASAFSQLTKIQGKENENASVSATQMTQSKFEPKPSRMLMMNVTDGHQALQAMEYQTIAGLSVDIPPGTKIVVQSSIECRLGVLMLTGAHVKVLGGEVEKLVAEQSQEKVLCRAIGVAVPDRPANQGRQAPPTVNTPATSTIDLTADEDLMEINEPQGQNRRKSSPALQSSRTVNSSNNSAERHPAAQFSNQTNHNPRRPSQSKTTNQMSPYGQTRSGNSLQSRNSFGRQRSSSSSSNSSDSRRKSLVKDDFQDHPPWDEDAMEEYEIDEMVLLEIERAEKMEMDNSAKKQEPVVDPDWPSDDDIDEYVLQQIEDRLQGNLQKLEPAESSVKKSSVCVINKSTKLSLKKNNGNSSRPIGSGHFQSFQEEGVFKYPKKSLEKNRNNNPVLSSSNKHNFVPAIPNPDMDNNQRFASAFPTPKTDSKSSFISAFPKPNTDSKSSFVSTFPKEKIVKPSEKQEESLDLPKQTFVSTVLKAPSPNLLMSEKPSALKQEPPDYENKVFDLKQEKETCNVPTNEIKAHPAIQTNLHMDRMHSVSKGLVTVKPIGNQGQFSPSSSKPSPAVALATRIVKDDIASMDPKRRRLHSGSGCTQSAPFTMMYLAEVADTIRSTEEHFTFQIRAFIMTLLSGLDKANDQWCLRVKVNDGTAAEAMDLDNQILTNLIGFSVTEMKQMRSIMATAPQEEAKTTELRLREGLAKCQRALVDLCGIMTVEMRPGLEHPLVINIRDPNEMDCQQLQKLVDTRRM